MHDTHPLHWSQKLFWTSCSLCMLCATFAFCWRLRQNTDASIELFGIKATCNKAQQSIGDTKDALVILRTRFQGALEQRDITTATDLLSDFDSILKTLGVAEAALTKQRRTLYSTSYGYEGDYSGSYENVGDVMGYRSSENVGDVMRTAPPQQPSGARKVPGSRPHH